MSLMKKLDVDSIVQHRFCAREYKRETYEKNQIVLHHTVSGDGIDGDVTWWLKDGKRIGTCVLIARDGTIHQVFSSKYWAYHLGENGRDHRSKGLRYRRNDMNSIGIEIDSWGGLVKHSDSQWYPAKWDRSKRAMVANTKIDPIPTENVQVYPTGYRGFYGFEKYTDAQIESVRQLLVFWSDRYEIPMDYRPEMFELCASALKGEKGVFTHTSFRSDKSDCHPQPELTNMLRSIS